MSKRNTVIVLGGAGYIGSHACLALHTAGFSPLVIDRLSTGHRQAVQWGELIIADILDTDKLIDIFQEHNPVAVMHFAALSSVKESVGRPGTYWENNVAGTLSVLRAMTKAHVPHIVFSSTAAVYGEPDLDTAITEDLSLRPINPYGKTKLAAEYMIRDMGAAHNISSVCLRYFNACGADPEAQIGEMHFPETHLVPLVLQTALGLREQISIYGTDYPTKDGTCIRDYIHVMDLAQAHVNALQYLMDSGTTTYCNLGTNTGYSVREIIEAAQEVAESDFEVAHAPRRAGDPAILVADNTRAKEILNWQPSQNLRTSIEDALKWHKTEAYQKFWLSKHNQTL